MQYNVGGDGVKRGVRALSSSVKNQVQVEYTGELIPLDHQGIAPHGDKNHAMA
jgi:hypothetical protein